MEAAFGGVVGDEAFGFSEVGNAVLGVVVEFDGIALLEADPANGGGLHGVMSVLACGGEKDLDAAEAEFEDHAESEFWFCVANPSLPCCRSVH